TVPATVTPAKAGGSQEPAPARRPFPGRDQPWDVGRPRYRGACLPSVTTCHGNGRKIMPDLPVIDPPAIVVTASRAEEKASDTPASVSLIDAKRIERLGTPLVSDLLRLTPSASVAVSGPAGSQAQL